jgi:hypothetical protein
MSGFDDHKARLRAFAEPGGPLARDTPYATIRNRRWFERKRGGRLAPTDERQALHDRLLAEHAATGARSDTPVAIVLAGPPGAGKSTSQEALIRSSGLDRDQWRVVNNDDFKDQLLRAAIDDGSYESDVLPPEIAASGEKVYPRELATLVHDEAGILADEALDRSIRDRANLIYDGTLSNEADAHDLAGRLGKAGYDVRVAVVDAPREVVEARVEHRWRSGYEAARNGTAATPQEAEFGGRSVPSGVVRHMYRGDDQQSICVGIARGVAERHGCVSEYRHARVTAPAGSPQPVEERGRLHPGGPLLDAETYRAAGNARASQPRARRPHVSAGTQATAAKRPARAPDHGVER